MIWSGHHDTYRSDKIVELAADVGISPFPPNPWKFVNLHCYKGIFWNYSSPRKIAEELGFERREEPAYEVNGKRNLFHWGMPDNTLTWLLTRPSPPHDYLAECKMTAHAVVPIHMNGELKLFNDLMRSERFYRKDQRRIAAKCSQSVDFTSFWRNRQFLFILLLLRIGIRIMKSTITEQLGKHC